MEGLSNPPDMQLMGELQHIQVYLLEPPDWSGRQIGHPPIGD